MKKTVCILFLAAIVLLTGCTASKNDDFEKTVKTVATVNGEEITSEEIDYFQSVFRADVVGNHPKECTEPDFWETPIDGKTPAEELDELAFSEAVADKIKLVLMREKGIYEDISYEALRKKAEQYNEEHQNKSDTVGITSVPLDSFYTYYISTGELELLNRLSENELKPSEAEIKDYLLKYPSSTEDGAVFALAKEKYEPYIAALVEGAEIIKER